MSDIVPSIVDPSKPHICPLGKKPITCDCPTCERAKAFASSRASLARAYARSVLPPRILSAPEPTAPRETTKEKYERQRRERYEQLEITTAYLKANEARYAAQRAEVLSRRPMAKTGYLDGNKTINVESPTIEEMLENPELGGIKSVNIDPVSMAVETVVDLIDGAKEFIANPSLGSAAMVAVAAIPGKYADKIVDELPLKKLDKAMAKTLHTMKRFKVPCFEPGKAIKGKFKGRERDLESHFARQLKNQESGLNDLTVGEYLENRNRYKKMKRSGTGLAQEDFRSRFSKKLKRSLRDSYRDKYSAVEAKLKATERTSEIMNNLAALHDPDMIAGGTDKVSRMGDKRVNSSIGSQWRNPSRLALMDEKAKLTFETLGPDAKMNVSLERCSLNGKK